MQRHKRFELLVVIGILVVASFFRFYQLEKYPPGLYPDEAMNGSNALVANATGHYQIFYPENTGREGLFINIQAFSVKIFGNHPWALRVVSVLFGVLTILGLYLLTRELFEWRIASVSSFLMAISLWHVNFSRIGFRAIMLPFILVYAFYFFWKGLKKSNWVSFFWSGVFWGLGFYTYTAYRIAPLILFLVFVSYWMFLKKDYQHQNYEHTRNRFLGGFSLLMITMFFVALPIGIYFLKNPQNFMQRNTQSVFVQSQPIRELTNSVVRTLGMFSFQGDSNPRHNLNSQPMLGWPISVLFMIGFLKELYHLIRRKHGHISPIHALMFSWFFVFLLPGFLSTEAPHALRAIGVIPIVMIFAGRGFMWLLNASEEWEMSRYPWENKNGKQFITPIVAGLALMVALGFYEYNRYFNIFGPSEITAGAFTANYVEIANQINSTPIKKLKYVIIDAPAMNAYGLPVSAETVMFLTDTVTPATQKAKNLIYLTADQAIGYKFNPTATIWHIR
ncbi:MAG: glycosyltransferase family 39 protein [Candidatus Pacebacteria bacterium]|nr:glycosyltransferase family 39 protein [Candidatus Paceibacterota bacterium]